MHYNWFKALHVIALISWLAGLLYLPRLFVYHTAAARGSELSETFKTMENRLLRFIMNPAMILTWIFGLSMFMANIDVFKTAGWMHVKFLCVVILTAFHMVLARHRRLFAVDKNTKSAKYFRIMNEAPTLLMIIIVIMAVAEPF